MTVFRRPAAVLAISTFLASAAVLPAAALDAEAFGERLKAVVTASQGVVVDWSAISADGDSIVLEGVTVGLPGETEKVEIGDVTLNEVTEEDGGYRVGSLELPHYVFEQPEGRVSVDGVSISGLVVPAEGASGPMGELMIYERAAVESATVEMGGKQLFTLGNAHAEITLPEGENPLEFTGGAESFTVDIAATGEQKAIEAAKELGLSTINGNVEMSGTWSPKDGRALLERYDLTVDQAGTLGMTLDISGYTAEFMKSLQEIQMKMAEGTEEEKSAQQLAMLGLLQQLNFHGASIRFDDDSLTEKVLSYAAKQQGAQPGDIANQAKFMLPMMLAPLNNPDFVASVTEAVSAFLDNPQNLTISAQPEKPVPFALIAAGAMAAPQGLIQQLGVTVTANE